jgi:hypothetical protein
MSNARLRLAFAGYMAPAGRTFRLMLGEPPGSPRPLHGPLRGHALRAFPLTPSTAPLRGQAALRPPPRTLFSMKKDRLVKSESSGSLVTAVSRTRDGELRSSLYRLLAGGQGGMGGSLRWRISSRGPSRGHGGRGACRSEGAVAGEHVPDRLREPAGEVDLSNPGTALLSEPELRPLVALAVAGCRLAWLVASTSAQRR